MDILNTPYDEEDQFIDCTICEKSIRGDNLYKIHLTSPAHLKKEDFLVAQGLAVRKQIVPTFEDIREYLDYLKLDEPIIGLNYLEEISRTDPQLGPNYLCKLCKQTSPLANMVCHLIGRKHRLKYIEEKRSDLVTWDGQTIRNQGGKIMRAKAEIIERQDGRGTPKMLMRRGTEGNLNVTNCTVSQRQRNQYMQRANFQKMTPPIPEFSNYNRTPVEFPNKSTFYPDEFNTNRNRDSISCDRDEELQRMNYNGGRGYAENVMNPEYECSYGDKYTKEPQRSVGLDSRDFPRNDFKEQMPYRQNQEVNYYPEKTSLGKRAYPGKNDLEEFYNEEVWRGQHRSHEYSPSQSAYGGGGKQWWSLDSVSDIPGGTNRAHIQEPNEPEAKKRNALSLQTVSSLQGLFEIVKDGQNQGDKTYKEETFCTSGSSRTESLTSQRATEVSSTISKMPEPFQRFLKGAPSKEKFKRKSRFSDATPEDLKMMERDEYNPDVPQPLGNFRQTTPQRSGIQAPQPSGVYGGLQNKADNNKTWIPSQHQATDRQKGANKSQNVFDLLKNIEIANVEEAEFLKSKIGNLLQEFNDKKVEKAALDNQIRPGTSKSFVDLKPDPQLPQQHQFEISFGEDSDHRRSDLSRADRRGWQQMQYTPGEKYKEFQHPTDNRGQYNDERSNYHEWFEESRRPPGHQPAADLYQPRSSVNPITMEQVDRMQRNPRYSSNLDKITSALLELVGRK